MCYYECKTMAQTDKQDDRKNRGRPEKGERNNDAGKKRDKKKEGVFSALKDETQKSIIGILAFVLGVFFLLAAFEKAGVVGHYLYRGFDVLFGVGYFILPLLAFLLGASAFSEERPRFALHVMLGSILFILSGLGIISLLGGTFDGSPAAGGVVGGGISRAFMALFDFYASTVILFSLFVVSVVIIFETEVRFDGTRSLAGRLRAWIMSLRKPRVSEVALSPESAALLAAAPQKVAVADDTDEEAPQKQTAPTVPTKKKEKISDEEEFTPTPRHFSAPFSPPPLSLLEGDRGVPGVGDIKSNANIIKRTLQNFGITVEMDEVSIGPTVARYALKPAEGVRLSKIVALQHDLELALAASPVRIEAPIPGKSLVGIEVPNSTRTTVGLKTLFEAEEYQNSGKHLLLGLGRGISGKLHFANLAKMPHCLIAGATGSGKSVAIHAIVNSLLYRNPPEMLRFIMIDPKRVELTLYNKIPHLLTPVITDAKKAILALKWAAKEMDRRYDILETESVRDIESYHKNVVDPALKKAGGKRAEGDADTLPEQMPYIVIIIDELADIMTTYPRELESAIVRLAQMSRAVGIHLILSTQRPSVNVITGLIKANIPARIALQVSSQIDSRTILDTGGAEKLLGAGDMLYLSGEMSKPARIQSPFISETEVKKVVQHIVKNSDGMPASEITLTDVTGRDAIFEATVDEDGDVDDELYEQAREVVISAGKASTSYLQRRLKVGYARAARIVDMLEERGVVGPGEGSKPREVLEKLPPREEGV